MHTLYSCTCAAVLTSSAKRIRMLGLAEDTFGFAVTSHIHKQKAIRSLVHSIDSIPRK